MEMMENSFTSFVSGICSFSSRKSPHSSPPPSPRLPSLDGANLKAEGFGCSLRSQPLGRELRLRRNSYALRALPVPWMPPSGRHGLEIPPGFPPASVAPYSRALSPSALEVGVTMSVVAHRVGGRPVGECAPFGRNSR